MRPIDDQLLAAVRDGDRAALDRLLARHRDRVYRFGLRMCGEEEDAKDVLQETLIAAARTVKDFRGASSVSTWLYSIARSFCIKRRRTSKFAPERVESLEAIGPAGVAGVADGRRTPDEAISGREIRDVVRAGIEALHPRHREILVLRDLEELEIGEIAKRLGLTPQAVKSRLHRARVALRDRVAPAVGDATAEVVPEDAMCPEVAELLGRHLGDRIRGSACAEMERHLQRCTRCQARCDALRASLKLCRASGEDAVPPAVEQSVRSALRRALAGRA